MNWGFLKKEISDLTEISSISPECSVQRVADLATLGSEELVFISKKKFWERLLQRFEQNPFVGSFIIFTAEFYQQVDKECPFFTSENFFLTTDNLSLTMCEVSRVFFDYKRRQQNDFVDGRQMGTVNIDSTALIAQNVFIGKNVTIGKNVEIHAGCSIMSNSQVGDDSVLFPNVTLYPETIVGKNCIVHAGTVLGSDGYGFNFINGKHEKIWHLGHVELEDCVEVGANCSIDRGTFGVTKIGQGTKLDNLVHIAHNVELAEHVLLCGQVGIAGSTKVGAYSVFAGQVGVTNDVEIGAQSQVGGGSIVTSHLPEKSVVSGHPARPVKEWLKGVATLRKMSLKK